MRINPTNFFKRELDILPPHFVNTVVKGQDSEIQRMKKWIYENCHGKYCIIDDVSLEGDNPASRLKVGFENPGDLTLLALSGLIGD